MRLSKPLDSGWNPTEESVTCEPADQAWLQAVMTNRNSSSNMSCGCNHPFNSSGHDTAEIRRQQARPRQRFGWQERDLLGLLARIIHQGLRAWDKPLIRCRIWMLKPFPSAPGGWRRQLARYNDPSLDPSVDCDAGRGCAGSTACWRARPQATKASQSAAYSRRVSAAWGTGIAADAMAT